MSEIRTTEKPIRVFFNNPRGDSIKEFEYFKKNGKVSVWSHFIFDYLKHTLKIEFSNEQNDRINKESRYEWESYIQIIKSKNKKVFDSFMTIAPSDNRTLLNLIQRKSILVYFDYLKANDKELKDLLPL